jgi:threonylcarbamoyladenosine tRNA methylthiotransferase MtaB
VTRVAASFVGCKVSQADGEEALAGLAAAGLEPVAVKEAADVVVVHTCCVTAEAERKSRRLVRRAASAGRRVVVSGCAAALHPEQFAGEGVTVAAHPDWTVVAADIQDDRGPVRERGSRLEGEPTIRGARGGARPTGTASGATSGAATTVGGAPGDTTGGASSGRSYPVPAGGRERPPVVPPAGQEVGPQPVFESAPRATHGVRTRLMLKVQDGCAGACTYCVVRLVRGAPRSVPAAQALAAAREGLAQGCGEVVLSGIDLGAWRDGRARLPELVAAVAELDGLRRVRLSSVEPRHVDAALLGLLAHPRVARHLHVPLQSADDGVLRDMRRPYTFARYLRAVEGLRTVPGGAMLSTDVIVGFPTEDEAAFARTLEALESGLFGRVHVFAYSARPGTVAAELPPLPAAVVKERMGRALAAAEAAALAARRAALGREAEILVEERRDGLWKGYSSEYVRYSLRGHARRGDLACAVADEITDDGVAGSVKE